MMNPLRELKLNQPGRIEHVGAPARRGVDGTVREISKEAILLELQGTNDGVEFQVGQRVTFKYWDVFGLHRGETEVKHVSTGTPRGATELSVAPPDRIELTQKRKFFRVNVSVPVLLRMRGEPSRGDGLEIEIDTRTEDLTPAGMRVTSAIALSVGDILDARIDFAASTGDPASPVEATARVVRAGRAPDGVQYTASVEFLGLPEPEQMRISLILFELQRHVSS